MLKKSLSYSNSSWTFSYIFEIFIFDYINNKKKILICLNSSTSSKYFFELRFIKSTYSLEKHSFKISFSLSSIIKNYVILKKKFTV